MTRQVEQRAELRWVISQPQEHRLVDATTAGQWVLRRPVLLRASYVAPSEAPRCPVLSTQAVTGALRESGGNVSAAAPALGYSRAAVREKAAAYLATSRGH